MGNRSPDDDLNNFGCADGSAACARSHVNLYNVPGCSWRYAVVSFVGNGGGVCKHVRVGLYGLAPALLNMRSNRKDSIGKYLEEHKGAHLSANAPGAERRRNSSKQADTVDKARCKEFGFHPIDGRLLRLRVRLCCRAGKQGDGPLRDWIAAGCHTKKPNDRS